MTRTNKLVVALCATLCLAPQIPDRTVLVKNNSATTLSCSVKPSNRPWQPWFSLAPGSEWRERAPSAEPYLIRCRAPVVPAAFRIVPGERYSLLRQSAGAITLRRITPDE